VSFESTYDLVVVGAGIAGLATAELFARSGRKVALIERNKFVCNESSGSHHEWFHFGSLYAIFPTNDYMRTLVGGVDDLLAFYSGFSGMNLRVDAGGKLRVADVPGNWIRDTPIEYLVTARNDPDFSLSRFDGTLDYARKLFFLLTWEAAIKQFISRHQRFHSFDWRRGQASEWVPRRGWWNYSRDVIHAVKNLDVALDPHTHFLVPGFDRPMESQTIITDLLRSFIHHGGDLRVATSVSNIRVAGGGTQEVLTADGEAIRGKEVVVASGRGIHQFLEGPSDRLKVVLSPLLVAYPAVSKRNFVRLTPFPEKTVNHLRHSAAGKPYSLIGGSYYAAIGDDAGLERARRELLDMARGIFPEIEQCEVVQTYESYKVEFAGKGTERNYQYHVREMRPHLHVIVPGKFSLAFSLAISTFRKIAAEEPPASSTVPEIDVSPYVAAVRHKRVVLEYLGGAAACGRA
jgi:glycine/D-amino acid oxidase-like deaminating enzyme